MFVHDRIPIDQSICGARFYCGLCVGNTGRPKPAVLFWPNKLLSDVRFNEKLSHRGSMGLLSSTTRREVRILLPRGHWTMRRRTCWPVDHSYDRGEPGVCGLQVWICSSSMNEDISLSNKRDNVINSCIPSTVNSDSSWTGEDPREFHVHTLLQWS